MKKIVTRAIMEVLGSPKDHVESTAKDLVESIKERKEIELVKSNISESKEVKVSDKQPENIKFFSIIIEVEIGVENIEKLVGFCFDFMPSSIDILEPSTLEMDARDVNGVLNDLMARLHRYDMFLKNLKAHAAMLEKELEKNKK